MDSKVVHQLPLLEEDEEVDIKKSKLNENDSFDVDHAVSQDKADVKKLDEETKVIPSREQRLEWFISLFKNRKELEKYYEEEYDSDDGTHSLSFRDIASFELDMYESGVST